MTKINIQNVASKKIEQAFPFLSDRKIFEPI
jgi:hypothetical protein